MKLPIILVPFLPAAGMALFPFILVKTIGLKAHKTLVNHEKIHLKQQLELLIIPFYILYLLHYLFNLLRYFNHDKAYRNIIFEREAYQNDKNLSYLNNRSLWAWTAYFSKKYRSD